MFFTYLIYVYVMLLCVYGAERYVYFTFPGLYGNVTRTLHKCVILYTAYPEIYTFPWSCKRVFSCQILHTYIHTINRYVYSTPANDNPQNSRTSGALTETQ